MRSPDRSTGPEAADAAIGHQSGKRISRSPLTHLILAFIVAALVQGFILKVFTIPSNSMSATLEPNDRVLVSRLNTTPDVGDVVVFTVDPRLWGKEESDPAGAATDPSIAVQQGARWVLGDLLGIGPTTGQTLVKRVIGTPNDTVECCDADGRVMVNGQALSEQYIVGNEPFELGVIDCATLQRSLRCFGPVVVPNGMLFVLGDNRGVSSDSATLCRGFAGDVDGCVRWVRASEVIGEVAMIVWPVERLGLIH